MLSAVVHVWHDARMGLASVEEPERAPLCVKANAAKVCHLSDCLLHVLAQSGVPEVGPRECASVCMHVCVCVG